MAVRLDPFKNIVALNLGAYPVRFEAYIEVADSINPINASWVGFTVDVIDDGSTGPRSEAEGSVNDNFFPDESGAVPDYFDITIDIDPVDDFGVTWQVQLLVEPLSEAGEVPLRFGGGDGNIWSTSEKRLIDWSNTGDGTSLPGGANTMVVRVHKSAPDEDDEPYPGTPWLEFISWG